ncbi:MAG: PEP-CTERM sorting domain-containing protein [Planctomycetota bacterium]
MTTKTALLALGTAILVGASAGNTRAATLYEHSFDGPDASINGIAPDTVVTGSVLGADHGTGGNWTTGGIDQDGTASSNAIAKLAFDPQDGFVYTLEMTGTQSSTNNDWIGVGFFDSSTTSALSGNGVAWGLSRPGSTTTTNRQVAHFNPAGGTGNIGTDDETTSPTTLTIVLDTSDGSGSWDVQWFADGSLTPFATQNDLNATAEGNISAVGVGVPGGAGNSDFTSFSLTVVPEPSSLALLSLGGLLIARRRRG